MNEHLCWRQYISVVLYNSMLFSSFLILYFCHKVIVEIFGTGRTQTPPHGLERPLTLAFYFLTFLSLATYALFMLGIHKYNTRLMWPWALVIGFKCIAGGAILIYFSYYVNAATLFEGMIYYSALIFSFICIYKCYIRVFALRKLVEQKLAERMPFMKNISIINVPDEEPKTLV